MSIANLNNISPISIFNLYYPPNFCNFIYANNFLHCVGYQTPFDSMSTSGLSPIKRIEYVISEAHGLLIENGIFFGRTLSDSIDYRKLFLLDIKDKKSDEEDFVLKTCEALGTGELIGISPEQLKSFGYTVGFRYCYTQIKNDDVWKPITDFYFRMEK